MICFKQRVFNRIKLASNEQEVEYTVHDSIQRLNVKTVNGHLIQRYIERIKTLQHAKTESPSPKALKNMDFAIIIFKKLQKP
jgi:hypothetical protein